MRAFFACGAALLLALLVSQAALAQAWPNRPVRFLVPFAAGAGINDIMARLVGQHLSAGLGQPVVIENRELARRLDALEAKYDRQFKVVFDAIRKLMTPAAPPKRRIGFVTQN